MYLDASNANTNYNLCDFHYKATPYSQCYYNADEYFDVVSFSGTSSDESYYWVSSNDTTPSDVNDIVSHEAPSVKGITELGRSAHQAICSLTGTLSTLAITEGSDDQDAINRTYDCLRQLEMKYMALPYMNKQPYITREDRYDIIDELLSLCGGNYNLNPETIMLALNYMDRFLGEWSVSKGRLNLVAMTCLFIACKYEESFSLSVHNIVVLCNYVYTSKEVIRTEQLILRTLKYGLSAPTTLNFCLMFLELCDHGPWALHVKYCAMKLIKLTMLDDTFMHYKPSVLAASIVTVASGSLLPVGHIEAWPTFMADYTKYSVEYLLPCIMDIHNCFVSLPLAEQKKYMFMQNEQIAESSAKSD